MEMQALLQSTLQSVRRMKNGIAKLLTHLRSFIAAILKQGPRMATLSTIGLPSPVDFATPYYEAINRRVSTKKDSHPAEWLQCAAAWNAVAYRFISCYIVYGTLQGIH